jgi:hypothetical protein
MILNLVRSDTYDLEIPSLTLKIHDELKDKEISYYELKQLQLQMKSSPQLLSQITQKFTNEYGPESMV